MRPRSRELPCSSDISASREEPNRPTRDSEPFDLRVLRRCIWSLRHSVASGRVPSAQAGTVRGMPFDWSADLAIAPDGALQRIAAAINRPKKRAFGVLKTENEYVGFIRDDTFEIWERQGRAIHGRGMVRGRRGGSRVEVLLVLPRWTKALVALFFSLYVLVAAGIATQPPRTEISIEELAIALAGAALIAAIFAAGAAQQRSDLRRFLERIFEEVPRI